MGTYYIYKISVEYFLDFFIEIFIFSSVIIHLIEFNRLKKKLMLFRKKAILMVLLPLLLILINILALNCIAWLNNSAPDYWPTTSWRTSTPEEQGMNSVKLQEMQDYIQTQNYLIHSMIIVRNGYIVHEYYDAPLYNENISKNIYSVTKSFTSALIGIAIDKGYISSINETVIDFFPERIIANLDTRKQAIKLKHLLTMTAGLEYDEWTYPYSDSRNSYLQMISSGDITQFVLDLPMVSDPGTTWVYNTVASHLLSAIINQTTGYTTLDFANEFLFEPLGISVPFWRQDAIGIYYGGSEFNLIPRDMAKFGYLYLNKGTWDGEQIVSSTWVDESTKEWNTLWYEQGYGYQWWIDTELDGYSARGYGGQMIHVIPNYNLVVVFTAYDLINPIPFSSLIENYVIPAIGDNPLIIIILLVFMIGIPLVIGVVYLIRKKIVSKDK